VPWHAEARVVEGVRLDPAALLTGAGRISELNGLAESVAARIEQALLGAADASGQADLARSLATLNATQLERMMQLGALYERIARDAKTAATSYSATDHQGADAFGTIPTALP